MNKLKNSYRVSFLTRKGGETHRVIDVEAYTIEEAKQTVRTMWYQYNKSHMFHIEAKRLKDNEEFLYNYFVRANISKDLI